jgi:type IV pilus assembly protein PilA
MKSSLKAKYYQLLLINNKTGSGFTLIELLVVILIIGILSVMGFNSFLNFAPKAKQSEAKTSIASINSAQNSYVLERSTFANTIDQLSLGLPTTTTNYDYIIVGGNASIATVNANTINTALKSYAGAVEKYNDANDKVVITTIICESTLAGNNIAVLTSGKPGTGACATNKELGQ